MIITTLCGLKYKHIVHYCPLYIHLVMMSFMGPSSLRRCIWWYARFYVSIHIVSNRILRISSISANNKWGEIKPLVTPIINLLQYTIPETGGSNGGAILALLFLFNYNMALLAWLGVISPTYWPL